MIVFSREVDESLVIGDEIVVTVVAIYGDKIRLGISCPVHMPVHRQEIYEAICRDAAASPALQIVPAADEPVEPASVRLSASQWAGIDRVRDKLARNSGRRPGRRETAEAVLHAFAEVEIEVGEAVTLADLKRLVVDALAPARSSRRQ